MFSPVQNDDAVLIEFEAHHAASILTWLQSAQECFFWAALDEFPPDVSVFANWHADPDIRPFVLSCQGELKAYGEIWEDDDGSVELGRLLVDHKCRRTGVGSQLIRRLCDKCHEAGFDEIWLRVFAENTIAKACYLRAGFRKVDVTQQAELNAKQRHTCVWMKKVNETIRS